MKRRLCRSLATLALLGALSGAGAEKLCAQQAANLPEVPDDAPWNKASLTKISIALAQPSTSDYLLAMARAVDANLLADASEFPVKSPPLTGQWKHFTSSSDGKQWQGYLHELLLALAHERKLTMREFPTRTFLLWSEPDMGMLGRGVSAALPNMTGFQFDPFAALKQQAPLRRALVSYLINDLQWDGRAVREVRSAQLPAALQQQMRALVFQPETILPFTSRDQVWYRDDFWNSAVLHIPFQGGRAAPDATKIQITGIASRNNKQAVTSSRMMYHPAGAFSSTESLDGLTPVLLQNGEEAETEAAQPKASEVASQPTAEVTAPLDLKAEAELRTKIALEANRRPLPTLMADVNRQSGLQLTTPDTINKRLLTVRVNRMPVAEWMQRLSDLLGGSWEKTGDKAYALRPPASPLDAQVLQMGDTNWFHFWQSRSSFDKAMLPPQLKLESVPAEIQAIALQLDTVRLMQIPRAEDIKNDLAAGRLNFGIPLTELEPEQVATLRRYVESQAAQALIDAYRRYQQFSPAALSNMVLQLQPPEPHAPIKDDQGRLIPVSGGDDYQVLFKSPSGNHLTSLRFRPEDFAPAEAATIPGG